jgi:hypothetical protein
MKVNGFRGLRMVLLAAGISVAANANAAIYNFNYSGKVTSVDLFSGLPELPLATVKVGDAFNGSFTIDTDKIGTDDGTYAVAPIDTISFNLPSQDYTEDFVGPGGAAYSNFATGNTSIVGGRPDYGRQLSLNLNLGASSVFDPTRLFGKSASLSFADYAPNGFSIQGLTNIAAISSVPETGPWGMMILGFVGMGAAMRYRRKLTKVAFA